VSFGGRTPVIIDCLEFSRQLRTQDVADEIGFLALECERAHSSQAARTLLDSYRRASGDPLPEALLNFHQSCRACVRARLTISHLVDPGHADPRRWRRVTPCYSRSPIGT
jgi:aminoglycoside phosphotransferase family enzyme